MDFDENGNVLDGVGDTSTASPGQDYVYDPFTGLPIADPSGILRSQGYETQAVDAPTEIAHNVSTYVADSVSNLFSALKLVALGAIVIVVLEAKAEVNRVLPTKSKRRRK